MSQRASPYHDRRVENNRIKSLTSESFIQKIRRDVPDDSQYDRDDRTSRSDTPLSCPSMIDNPSTSAASSITACDHFVDAGQCVTCQNCSDLEIYQYQNSEADSPRTNPAVLRPKTVEKHWDNQYTANLGYKGRRTQNVVSPFPPLKCPPSVPSGVSCVHDLHEEVRPKANGTNIPSFPIPGNAVSSGGVQNQPVPRRNAIEEVSESDNGDDENEECDDDDDDDDDDENDWSGQDDNLEARLVEALGHDLPLAAYLIPHLYKLLHSEVSARVIRTVGPWCNAVTKCSPDGGTDNGKSSSYNAAGNTSNVSNSDDRKRSRGLDPMGHDHEPDDEDEEDEDEDDDKRDPKRSKNHRESGGASPSPRLACPFYKFEPSKYGVQHEVVENGKKTEYRVCAGPGFKSITRLKEHLKRKHYPVQCERCYFIFDGNSDRAVRVRDLESHRQLPTPCERGDKSLKEGISDAQWASLDRKKKNQGSSNIEKWNEIWAILFPDTMCPKTPWYDQNLSDIPSPPPSEGCSQFLELFKGILKHKIGQQHIRLEDGMHSRIVTAVQVAFETWSRTFRSDRGLSSTDSSSAQHTSWLDGSYQHISQSQPRTHRQSTNSQAYSADILGSSSGSAMIKPGRRQRDSTGMDSRYMGHQSHYALGSMGAGLSPEPRTFPVDALDTFVSDPFTNNSMRDDTEPYYMDFEAPGSHYDDPNVAGRAAFQNPTAGINPNQTFITSPGNQAHHNLSAYPPNNWPNHYTGQGRPHYGGGQT